MGFAIANPQIFELNDDLVKSYVGGLEYVLSKMSPSPQFIFCVVSNSNAARYSAIKTKCCVDRPIPTQIFLSRNLTNRGLMSIATKVAIQMNCKIGGVPWSVDIPVQGLMVVGYDVCHDTSNKARDFGMLVK